MRWPHHDWKFNDPAPAAHLHVIAEEALERVALVQVEDVVARCKQHVWYVHVLHPCEGTWN